MLTHEEAQEIATDNDLGVVQFSNRIAQNTGKTIELGHVYQEGRRELFCKRQSHMEGFYLCNQFRELE